MVVDHRDDAEMVEKLVEVLKLFQGMSPVQIMRILERPTGGNRGA